METWYNTTLFYIWINGLSSGTNFIIIEFLYVSIISMEVKNYI